MLLDLGTFTAIHTALSLVAIPVGIVAMLSLFGLPVSRRWIAAFLALAVLTTVTGFFFPFQGVTPAFATGIIASLVLLAVFAAQYAGRYAGPWRWVYAGGVVASLYFLVFVTIAQVFTKTPALQDTAALPGGPAFAVTQLGALAVFVVLGIGAAKSFKPS